MIGKVLAAGNDGGGLVRYCMSPGNKQTNAFGEDLHPHINQRTVAGNCLDLHPGASKAEIAQAAADLRSHALLNPGVTSKEGLIRHHILAANPGDRPITDPQWRTIATEYVREMYPNPPGDYRWTAINHGPNAAGADHVHIVVNRVADNGRLLKLRQDENRCQAAVKGIEQRYGLTVLESRHADVGDNRGLTRVEYEQARRTGQQPQREYLAQAVRENALLASGPDHFLRLMAADRIDCQPKVKEGQLVGYSYRDLESGRRAYAGKDLGRDLSWPELQHSWQDSRRPTAKNLAVDDPFGIAPPPVPQRQPAAPDLIAAVQTEMARLADMTPAEFRAFSREVSVLQAAAARNATDPATRAKLTRAAQDTARWCGNPLRHGDGYTARTGLTQALKEVTRSNPNVDIDRLLLRVHESHQAARPAITEQTRQHKAAVDHARATLTAGHYRTPSGDVIRIARAHNTSRIYAATLDPGTGRWTPAPDRLLDAAQGQRLTTRQAQDHTRTAHRPARGGGVVTAAAVAAKRARQLDQQQDRQRDQPFRHSLGR